VRGSIAAVVKTLLEAVLLVVLVVVLFPANPGAPRLLWISG
jgi:multidrug efflux pump subunit AcrB